MLFLIEDNGYAISVPIECQTPGGNISKLVAGFPGPVPAGSGRHGFSRVATARCRRPRQYCREGHGPALVHAHVIRPYSHSLSDDERLYKTRGRARGRGGARPGAAFPEVPDRRRRARPAHAAAHHARDRRRGARGHAAGAARRAAGAGVGAARTSIRKRWIPTSDAVRRRSRSFTARR